MTEAVDNLPRTLLALVVDTKLLSLELKVQAGWTEDVGMIRHEGVPYAYKIEWTEDEGKYTFLLEVFKLVPVTRKNGKVRSDRMPKLAMIASHQFEQEVDNV